MIRAFIASLFCFFASHFAFANTNAFSERLGFLLKVGRIEFQLMRDSCGQNPESKHCTWARWRVYEIEQEILSDSTFPKNFRPSPMKQCWYAGVVACSLLGGPDPGEQGLTPWSSLSGQELSEPVELYRKQAAEAGAGRSGKGEKNVRK